MNLRNVGRGLAVAVAATLVAGLGAGPAAAATGVINISSTQYSCAYYASKNASYVRASNNQKVKCTDVGATVYYKTAGGKTYPGTIVVNESVATSYVPSGGTYYYGITEGRLADGVWREQTA